MKTTLLLAILLFSLAIEVSAQQPAASPGRLENTAPCGSRQTSKRIRRPVIKTGIAVPVQPAPEFFVGEAMVEVTKDQAVVRLAMAQHASVLIELPANDGPRYIIPGDPEMVTVDEKALERNKRAIIVRPGSLFVVPAPNHKRRMPAATVTAQMRSGLVVTFLFYPVADPAQNVHRCVLTYKRDEVVARRRGAGLPVNLDQIEQGDEKPAGPAGAPVSISVEPTGEAKVTHAELTNNATIALKNESALQSTQLDPRVTQVSNGTLRSISGTLITNEHAIATVKLLLARAVAEPGSFKSWTRPLHGLALAARYDGDLKEDFLVLLLAVKNVSLQTLKLVPGTPDLTLEMHDDKGRVINVQSIKPLHIESSDLGTGVAAGRTVYYAIAYSRPLMGVRHRLKIVVAQSNAIDEPASIGVLK